MPPTRRVGEEKPILHKFVALAPSLSLRRKCFLFLRVRNARVWWYTDADCPSNCQRLYFYLTLSSPTQADPFSSLSLWVGMDFAAIQRSRFPELFVAVSLLLSAIVISTTNASIHIYNNEPFREVGNAYLLSGGSEGIFSSLTVDNSAPSFTHDDRSYIRYSLTLSHIYTHKCMYKRLVALF